jgi:hypothetical protein
MTNSCLFGFKFLSAGFCIAFLLDLPKRPLVRSRPPVKPQFQVRASSRLLDHAQQSPSALSVYWNRLKSIFQRKKPEEAEDHRYHYFSQLPIGL